jgi:solute:Na+ symporter, SSS family
VDAKLGALDWLIIGLYFALVFGTAIWASVRERSRSTSAGYFLAGRNVGWFVIGASLFASNIGSEHLVGLAGTGAASGLAVGQFEILASLILLLLGWVFVPFYLKSGVFTMPEFLERRYSKGARSYLAGISIVGYVLTKISVTIAAGGVVFEALMGINFWTGALVVVVATGIYTVFGGLKAVLYTDMLQMFVLIGGSVTVTVIGVDQLGGVGPLIDGAGPGFLSLWKPISDPSFPWTGILFGAPILGVWYWCTDQFIVQRVLSAANADQARRGTIFGGFLKLLPLFIFVLPGVIAYALSKSGQLQLAEPDQALPTLIRQLLPVGLRGLVVAGLLAALMSSLSSVFNSCSTLITWDIYKRIRPEASERRLVLVGQLSTGLLVVLGLLWIPMMKQISGQLYQYLQSVQGYIAPPIAAVFLLGLFFRRCNAAGAMACLLTGFVLGLGRLIAELFKDALGDGWLLTFASVNFLHFAVLLFIVCAIVLIVVSLLTPAPPQEQVAGLTLGRSKSAPAPRRRGDMMLSLLLVALVGALWLLFSDLGLGRAGAVTTPKQEAPMKKEQPAAMRFEIREGAIDNHFYRRGSVAAHLLLRSGASPRLIVAFPAGNSGTGLWFEPTAEPAALKLVGQVQGVEQPEGLRGVQAEITASTGRLVVKRAVLGSVRVLRDYIHGGRVPATLQVEPKVTSSIVWRRARLDGKAGYLLRIEPSAGTRCREKDGRLIIEAVGDKPRVSFRATALTGDPPLTPIPLERLLRSGAGADVRARQALAFLTYEEKLLAGSWRFLTYFGRDTLLSVRLLMPALQEQAIEAALGSVFHRLGASGEVAHEEDIGEFAVLHNQKARPQAGDPARPVYDYKMVDDDFLLAPVVAHYLLDDPRGRPRARAFLARSEKRTYREALARNLALIVRAARPFAEHKDAAHLIALKPGAQVGEWRDSLEGLGQGRIPYNVNVALVPAALEAAGRLLAAGLVAGEGLEKQEIAALAEAWKDARRLFEVKLPRAQARQRLQAYTRELGLPAGSAARTGPVAFSALALRSDGSPVPVMHSDGGFELLFGHPAPEALTRLAQRIVDPFPLGLRTEVGLLVANPAYAPAEVQALFTRRHYHGTVIWSWQQALTAAGLRRQLLRSDLPPPTRQALRLAERRLWEAIGAASKMRSSELWTWKLSAGRYEAVPFGQQAGDQTESNAVQLWSTVYLALRPPR